MKKIIPFLALSVFIGLFSGVVFAQNKDKTVSPASDLYVISAKAGGVNLVEGKVTVESKNKKSEPLIKGDFLEVGDKVLTGTDGKAEILLNPGSYVRLAENSSFEFSTTSLENLQLKLNGGSAIFEVIADDEFKVGVNTPKANFSIVTSGVYRVSVLNDDTGKIVVWKGKAQVGELNPTDVKSGKEAVVNGNQVAIGKFDRDEKSDLENWSKIRAKDLAKVNTRLQRNDLRNSLISGFGTSRWDMYNSFGLWVFDASFGSYCFLPFGYGWSSPYGYSYGRDLWYFRLPKVIYNQPPAPVVGTTASKSRTRINTDMPMPYERVEMKRQRTSDAGNAQFPGMQSPSSAAPPVTVAPSNKRQRVINN